MYVVRFFVLKRHTCAHFIDFQIGFFLIFKTNLVIMNIVMLIWKWPTNKTDKNSLHLLHTEALYLEKEVMSGAWISTNTPLIFPYIL